MKKQIANKIIILLLISVITLVITATPTLATTVTWDSIQGQAKNFIGQGSEGDTINMSGINQTIVNIGQILTTVGLAVVMVGLLILGIKYMMASPEEAAKIKGQLVGLVVSAIVIFGAYGIWNIVVTFFKNMM